MSWLDVLKSLEAPRDHATKPTKPERETAKPLAEHATKPTKPGFVGFVASAQRSFANSHGAALRALRELEDRQAEQLAADLAQVLPDSWPHGPRWNAAEICRHGWRVALFQRRGMSEDAAHALADALIERDRTGDDRRHCVECAHLAGRRCGNWREVGYRRPADAPVGSAPRRCRGFAPVPGDPTQGVTP